ncbi:hypothetical protein Pelo_9158 [Pelomyxa schiedti]|nr:hypothetical protein Pelo_9158 [Pelomyxa schiedti]
MSNKVTLKEWMRAVRAIHETGGPSTDSLNLHGVSFRAFETLLSMLAYRSGCIINDSTAPKEDIKLEWHIPSAPGTTGQALGLVRVLEPPSSLRRGAARFISDRNNGNDTSWLFHTCIKASASPTDQAPSWATTACMSLLRSTATGKQAALVLDVAQHEPRRRFEERLLRICTALSHNDGGAAPLVIGIKLWCQEGSASNGRMQAIVIRPNPKVRLPPNLEPAPNKQKTHAFTKNRSLLWSGKKG